MTAALVALGVVVVLLAASAALYTWIEYMVYHGDIAGALLAMHDREQGTEDETARE